MAATITVVKKPALKPLSQKASVPELVGEIRAIRNWIDQLYGQGGVVAAQDMITAGLIRTNLAGNLVNNLPVGSVEYVTPPAITGLAVTGGFNYIFLSWDAQSYANFAYTEIWRSQDDDIGTAAKIGTTPSALYTDGPPDSGLSETYYYWIRPVNTAGVTGAYNAVAGTSGSTADDPAYMKELLVDEIDKTLLVPDIEKVVDLTDYYTAVNDHFDKGMDFWTAAEGNSPPNVAHLADGSITTGGAWGPNVWQRTGEDTVYWRTVIPVDTVLRTYRVRGRVRQTVDDANAAVSIGIVCLNNIYGALRYSWAAADSVQITIADGWTIFDGIITGTVGVTANTFHADTRYARPCVKVNATGGSGTAQVDGVEFYPIPREEELDPTLRYNLLNSGRIMFNETFEDAAALNEWEESSTFNLGENTIISRTDAETGGKVLQCGNNSGNDQTWLYHQKLIPFNPGWIYKTRVVARRVSGTGTLYCGFTGVAYNGTTLVSTAGTDEEGNSHYHAANGTSPGAGGWTIYEGITYGHGATVGTGVIGTVTTPGEMHPSVRYLRPLIVTGLSNQTGTFYIDSITVEVMSPTVLVMAETFAIVDPGASTVIPFAVSGGVTYIKAALIEDATITNAKIGLLAVDTAQIADAAITNLKIDTLDADKLYVDSGTIASAIIGVAEIESAMVNQLDANKISVLTGTIADAIIDTAHIKNAMIDTLAANKIEAGTIAVAIELTSATITAGLIRTAVSGERIELNTTTFKSYDSSKLRVELGYSGFTLHHTSASHSLDIIGSSSASTGSLTWYPFIRTQRYGGSAYNAVSYFEYSTTYGTMLDAQVLRFPLGVTTSGLSATDFTGCLVQDGSDLYWSNGTSWQQLNP